MNRSGLQDGYGIGLRKYNRCGDAEYNERIFNKYGKITRSKRNLR